jgi:hypothetical protein
MLEAFETWDMEDKRSENDTHEAAPLLMGEQLLQHQELETWILLYLPQRII